VAFNYCKKASTWECSRDSW